MIVVIADEAAAELERIGDFIAADNPRRAVTFVNELVERCLQLAAMPRAFPLVPHFESTGVRRRPFGSYVIFYRVGMERVDVLHILNAAQDYEPILFPQN